jgi:hypothetical protein
MMCLIIAVFSNFLSPRNSSVQIFPSAPSVYVPPLLSKMLTQYVECEGAAIFNFKVFKIVSFVKCIIRPLCI